jgi:phospholipase C
MSEINRRQFIGGAAAAAGLAGLVLSGCGSSNEASPPGSTTPGTEATTSGTQPLPAADQAPFDTVVVLMMENRSFDHMLGWMPGTNGRQDLTFLDRTGQSHPTWHMAPDWQGCDFQDPFHTTPAMNAHWNDGACDGFLTTQPADDYFPIGYYTQGDLPILESLAQGYTLFDNYFASILAPTWPNRLYQLCATTDLAETGVYPAPDSPRPVALDTAIFDRVQGAGKTAAYYTWGEPMTGLFQSRKYDALTHPIDQFWTDAKDGKLPNVVFVDPDYTSHSEFNGTSNDYHPYGSVRVAEGFVAQVHDALTASPQWDRMVFVLNFDESGGFFDHVNPPTVQDDTVKPAAMTLMFPTVTQLGFRVPCIAMGPFAPRKIESGGPYEHCSVLRMIEWRWGLEPMTLRDKNATNLAQALDFTTRRDPITLPAFTPEPAVVCTNTKHLG